MYNLKHRLSDHFCEVALLILVGLLPFNMIAYATPSSQQDSRDHTPPVSLEYLEQTGDRPLITIVIQPHQVPRALKFLQNQVDRLPLSPSLTQMIQTPHQHIPQLSLLSHLQPDKPILIAIGEVMVDPGSEGKIRAIRHRALIPSNDPSGLLQALSTFIPSQQRLSQETPVLGGKTKALAWQLQPGLIVAAFSEADHLRIEVGTMVTGLPPLHQFSQVAWARTPAIDALRSHRPVISAHLKTWRIREYITQYGYHTAKEAINMVREPDLKGKFTAMGLAHILSGELFMSERHLEADDLTFALQLNEHGLQLSAVMSLTPHGDRTLRMAVLGATTPELSFKAKPIVTSTLSFNQKVAFQEVKDLDGVNEGKQQGKGLAALVNTARDCGQLCLLHALTRKPLGLLKFIFSIKSDRDLFGSFSWSGFQMVLTELTTHSPRGTIAFALNPNTPREELNQLVKHIQTLQPSFTVKDHLLSDTQVITINMGADAAIGMIVKTISKPTQVLSEKDPLKVGAFSVRNLGGFEILNPLFRSLQPYQNWQLKLSSHLRHRALTWDLWFGEGDSAPTIQSTKLGIKSESWISPIRSRPSIPQDQCIRELYKHTAKVFYALAKSSAHERQNITAEVLQKHFVSLQCVREGKLSHARTRRLVRHFIEAVGLSVKGEDRDIYGSYLKDLCALDYRAACEVITAWKPLELDHCGQPKLSSGEATLKITVNQVTLDREQVTLKSIGAQLSVIDPHSGDQQSDTLSIAKRLSNPYTYPELKLIELDVHPDVKMSQVTPWLTAIEQGGYTHVMVVQRMVQNTRIKTKRTILQIAPSASRVFVRDGRKVFAIKRPSPSEKHHEIKSVIVKSGKAPLSHVEGLKVYDWDQISNQSPDAFTGDIELEIYPELLWSELIGVVGQSCGNVMIKLYNSGKKNTSKKLITTKTFDELSDPERKDHQPLANNMLSDLNQVNRLKNQPRVHGEVIGGRFKNEGKQFSETIVKIMKRQLSKFKYCYRRQLRNSPTLEGDLVLSLKIEKRGMIESVSMKGASINDPELKDCIKRKMIRVRFPKLKQDHLTTIDYLLSFQLKQSSKVKTEMR